MGREKNEKECIGFGFWKGGWEENGSSSAEDTGMRVADFSGICDKITRK